MMAEAGTPDYLLSYLMGHSDSSVTKKYYIGISNSSINESKKFTSLAFD